MRAIAVLIQKPAQKYFHLLLLNLVTFAGFN